MDRKQENQLSMFYAVQKTLMLNQAIWSATPAMVTASDEYTLNINAMESCVERQVIDIRGFAKSKAVAESKMIGHTLVVAGCVRAYAAVIGDTVLADKMNVTRSTLLRHRDAVVAQHSQGIHTAATEVVASLVPYGITAATLTALQDSIDNYVEALTAPRNAIMLRKGATTELKMLLRDTSKLLTKRLDALMESFGATEPEFYRDYYNARMILDLGTGSGDGNPNPVPVAA